jgi:CheY-like chemotaxis protein
MAEAHGFVVREAADGVEALALLAGGANRYVVLLDYSMPAMSGWGVLKAVAAANELAWHVYLMMTADRAALPGECTEFLERHNIPLLVKPIRAAPLLAALDLAQQQLADR